MLSGDKKPENVSRRTAIQTIGGTVLGLAVGAAAGYLGKPTPPAEMTTETVTETMTSTVTGTAAPPTTMAGGFDYATVGKRYSGQTVTVLVETGTRMDKWLATIAPQWQNLTGIVIQPLPMAFTQMGQGVLTDFAGKVGAYDIIYMVNFWGGLMAVGDHFNPMEDLIKQYPDLHDPTFVPELFLKKHMDLVGYWDVQKKINGSGKFTLISVFPDSFMNFYRKDWFEDPKEKDAFKSQYGYELTVPQTWKAHNDIAEFFTRPDKKMYGTTINGKMDSADFWAYFLSHGGQVWKYADGTWPPDNFTPNLDSQETVNALNELKQQVKWSPPGALGYGQVEHTDSFITQDIAQAPACWFFMGGKCLDRSISKVADKTGFGLTPGNIPENAGRVILGGWGAGVSRYSKHTEAAFLTIEYVTSEAINKKQVLSGFMSPVRTDLYSDSDLLSSQPYVAMQGETLKRCVSHHFNFLTNSFDFITITQEEATSAITGKKTPEQAAKDIQTRLVDTIKRAGYKVD
jgi:multiple sugar transport system substrate-binding protein